MTDPSTADWLTPYRETRDRLADLVRGLGDAAASTPVEACPGWDVHAVVSHLTGVLADIRDGRLEGAGTEAWTAEQVSVRRDRTLRDVVEEWDALQGFAEVLIPGLGANGSRMAADTLIHEVDVRVALGLDVPLDTGSWRTVADHYVAGLGERLADAGLGPVRLVTEVRDEVAGAGPPAATVRTSDFELVRALTGRRTPAQVASWDWDGPGDRYAEVWSAYGTPERDLVEAAA